MGIKYNFNTLLRPYRAGGTEQNPTRRTLETITGALISRYKFTPHEAGAAMLKVFHEMADNGLEFKGDGTYGSEGRELFSCIRAQATAMKQDEVMKEVELELAQEFHCARFGCSCRSHEMAINTKFKRILFNITKPWAMSVYGGLLGAGSVYGAFYLGYLFI